MGGKPENPEKIGIKKSRKMEKIRKTRKKLGSKKSRKMVKIPGKMGKKNPENPEKSILIAILPNSIQNYSWIKQNVLFIPFFICVFFKSVQITRIWPFWPSPPSSMNHQRFFQRFFFLFHIFCLFITWIFILGFFLSEVDRYIDVCN